MNTAKSVRTFRLCGRQLARHPRRQVVAAGGARLVARQAYLRRTRAFAGAHSDQHSCRPPQAPGKYRHHHQHSLSATSGALLLLAYPEGQCSWRGVARVCSLGQAAHTGYGHVEPELRGRRGCRISGELTPNAPSARDESVRSLGMAPFAVLRERERRMARQRDVDHSGGGEHHVAGNPDTTGLWAEGYRGGD